LFERIDCFCHALTLYLDHRGVNGCDLAMMIR
jgi:hypothetical protein